MEMGTGTCPYLFSKEGMIEDGHRYFTGHEDYMSDQDMLALESVTYR